MNVNDSKNTSRTDWDALEAMTDEEIDYSDIAPLTDEFFENATLTIPANKSSNLIELDSDVLAWFQAQGKEYKTMINSVLRRYIHER
ncbi:BrnA antitoxin family protein [Gloeothece verrucosa]|uniref:3-oxoacyl-ACP synthase n=1 Tax=Gloeothece verrucosa (strain PCC 7822) TaxID=497965 RepID=E0U710_GLOV7|nr:BrnA antitoxin family protein [Gloeothece verrucosa]ADN17166.1 conserved hypothetical protein [Gloeothece verrucosa PCC 7822]